MIPVTRQIHEMNTRSKASDEVNEPPPTSYSDMTPGFDDYTRPLVHKNVYSRYENSEMHCTR
jgi:hypothetical protein